MYKNLKVRLNIITTITGRHFGSLFVDTDAGPQFARYAHQYSPEEVYAQLMDRFREEEEFKY